MAKDDLFSVLSRGRATAKAPQTPPPVPELPPAPFPEPAPPPAPSPSGPPKPSIWPGIRRRAVEWTLTALSSRGRDRVLLLTLAGAVYSLTVLGIGICIGRAQVEGPGEPPAPPPVREFPIDRSLRAIELMNPGADRAAKQAEDALKQRFPVLRDQVFRLTQGKSVWVCIGKFRSAVPEDRAEMEKLKAQVAQCVFVFGKERRKFKPETVTLK